MDEGKEDFPITLVQSITLRDLRKSTNGDFFMKGILQHSNLQLKVLIFLRESMFEMNISNTSSCSPTDGFQRKEFKKRYGFNFINKFRYSSTLGNPHLIFIIPSIVHLPDPTADCKVAS